MLGRRRFTRGVVLVSSAATMAASGQSGEWSAPRNDRKRNRRISSVVVASEHDPIGRLHRCSKSKSFFLRFSAVFCWVSKETRGHYFQMWRPCRAWLKRLKVFVTRQREWNEGADKSPWLVCLFVGLGCDGRRMLQDGPAAYLFLPFIFVILWKRLVSLSLRPIMTRAGQVARPMLNKHLITRHVFGRFLIDSVRR